MESPDEADATGDATRDTAGDGTGSGAGNGTGTENETGNGLGDRDELGARIEELRARVRAANRRSLAGPDSPSLGPSPGQNDGDDTGA